MNRRLDAQDQCSETTTRERERPFQVAQSQDRVMRAGGQAQATPYAGLVDDPDLVAFDGYRIDGTHTYTGVASHAFIRIDSKFHESSVRLSGDRREGALTCDLITLSQWAVPTRLRPLREA